VNVPRRFRTAAVLFAAAALVAVPLAVPGPAAGNQPAKCTKLTAKPPAATKFKGTLSGCAPVAATGGSGTGTFVYSASGTLRVTIKWASGKGTTRANAKFANQTNPGRCKAATRVTITGKVTGGTGAAAKVIKKGQPITGSACFGAKGVTLEPGTVLKF